MFQPCKEKEAERQLIIGFVDKAKSRGKECRVVKLQNDNDDGKTDGVIEFCGKERNVEARRKGYPNHSGYAYFFKGGWKNELLLKEGIFLNELTINQYKNSSFIYLVDIEGDEPRACFVTKERVEELLKQPYREQKSTNSGKMQSVKMVPLAWFKEYY